MLYRGLVADVMTIEMSNLSKCLGFFQDDKDAFYVADLGDIVKKHIQWLKALPRVTPFYAVKCNDSKAIVTTIAILGAGFDCASKVCNRTGAKRKI